MMSFFFSIVTQGTPDNIVHGKHAHFPSLYIGFTRALCRELGPRSIRVNALLPGWIASDMWDSMLFPDPFILT